MFRNALGAVLVAALMVTAGCAGSVTSGPTAAGDGTATATGTVAFYVSDEPNAIDDFEHLNVTITKVGLHRTGDAETNATPVTDGGNGSATATPSPSSDDDADDADDGREADDGEWVEHEVDRRTVDLTELQGANATRLDALEAPAGTYDKAFIYVDDIDATLTTGEQVNVKLPSERLHVDREFTVGDGDAVEFVFDVSPHRAGKSGKYILKPVISQSGTGDEVDIRDVDERAGDDLDVRFVGPVDPGANATVKVTGPDGPVEGATVTVGDEVVGTTGADGTRSFRVPADAEELEATVTAGEAEAELEVEFDEADESDDGADGAEEQADDSDDAADEDEDAADDGGDGDDGA